MRIQRLGEHIVLWGDTSEEDRSLRALADERASVTITKAPAQKTDDLAARVAALEGWRAHFELGLLLSARMAGERILGSQEPLFGAGEVPAKPAGA